MVQYRTRCVLAEDFRLEDLGIDLREDHPIHVGRFVNRDLAPYKPVMRETSE